MHSLPPRIHDYHDIGRNILTLLISFGESLSCGCIPPLKLIPLVVDKIFQDQARGALLVTVNPEAQWLQNLTYVTFYCWDLTNDVPLFEVFREVVLPPFQEIIFRVCFFAAFSVSQSPALSVSVLDLTDHVGADTAFFYNADRHHRSAPTLWLI